MKELRIPKNEVEKWNRLLEMDVVDFEAEDVPMGFDKVACWTVRFEDGVEADLNVCACDGNYLFSEMCWYDSKGHELTFTEPNSKIDGEWGYEGDETHPDYSVNVVAV